MPGIRAPLLTKNIVISQHTRNAYSQKASLLLILRKVHKFMFGRFVGFVFKAVAKSFSKESGPCHYFINEQIIQIFIF